VRLAAAVVRLVAAAVVLLAAAVAGLERQLVGMALTSSSLLPLERCSLGWNDFQNRNKQASKRNTNNTLTISKKKGAFYVASLHL
jgi:hypothetical protein